MVVADARFAQRLVLRSRADADRARALGKAHQGFQNLRHILVGKTEITVTSLFLRFQELRVREFGQVPAGGLQRHTGGLRKLACGQRTSIHQRRQYVGAGRVADQRGDIGDQGAVFHASMITEALMQGNGVEEGGRTRGDQRC
ncbi:hypothetical protein D3C80_876210 [compost metagenome]